MSADGDPDNYAAMDQPAFWGACRNDDVPTVCELIREADSKTDSGGRLLASFWGEEEGEGYKLPIHEACECGSAEVLRVLLQASPYSVAKS